MLIKKSDLLFENPYRKIYKYRLEEGGQTTIAAYWAELLDIQVQEDNIVLWASVAPYCTDIMGDVQKREDKPTTLIFTALGTGWEYKNHNVGEYFKTVQMPSGLVWHIFVKEGPKE